MGNDGFVTTFDADLSIKMPTVLYVPKIHYPNDYEIILSEGEYEKKEEDQLVLIKVKEAGAHSVKITRFNNNTK